MEEIQFDVASLPYFSVHNHSEISNFRFSDSIIRVEQLIDRAIELGYNGVAITDHEAISGHMRFLEHYKELKKQNALPDNFKIALGNEIYLVDSLEDVRDNYVSGVTRYWHFILIAKDRKGYDQLKTISAQSAWENYFRQANQERVPTVKSELEAIIGEDKGHLIASTACMGGELPYLAMEYFRSSEVDAPIYKRKIHEFISWCIHVFGKENFYIELQPSANNGTEQSETQAFSNQCLLKIAKAYGLKCIVTTDSHYLKAEDRSIHEAYLSADDSMGGSREAGDFYETTYMCSKSEIYNMLCNHMVEDDAVATFANTMDIWENVEDYDLSHPVIVPTDPHEPVFTLQHIFKDWYDQYEYIKKFAHSENIQERYFLALCEEGFLNKSEEFNETNIARIDVELGELWEISAKLGHRIASYYTLVRTIIHEIMWKVSYVGIARGSVTGFYTAYLSGITQVNPIVYNLPHWRHLERNRPELPDIDVDTEQRKRQQIIQGMRDYFGKDNILNTLTLRTEGSKSATLTACRGLGIDIDTAQAIADMIPFERGANYSLSDCFYGNGEKGRKPVSDFIHEVEQFPRLKEVMFMIEGLICGRGIHASAVYIFDDGYLSMNGRMRAPNGEYITAFNMGDSDAQGALKFDCLTIAALDKLHITMDMLCEAGLCEQQSTIKATYDKYVHPDVLDYTNLTMWKMLNENALIDAFQFDTPQGIQVLKTVHPQSILQLAVANTLMRLMAPEGEEQPADTYAKHKANISLWYEEMRNFGLTEEEIKILEPHLLPLYGVAESQEAVMKLSMDPNIAGFTVAEANKIRKSIAKKKPKLLAESQTLFYEKGKALGSSEKLLDYVWNVQFKKSFGLTKEQPK